MQPQRRSVTSTFSPGVMEQPEARPAPPTPWQVGAIPRPGRAGRGLEEGAEIRGRGHPRPPQCLFQPHGAASRAAAARHRHPPCTGCPQCAGGWRAVAFGGGGRAVLVLWVRPGREDEMLHMKLHASQVKERCRAVNKIRTAKKCNNARMEHANTYAYIHAQVRMKQLKGRKLLPGARGAAPPARCLPWFLGGGPGRDAGPGGHADGHGQPCHGSDGCARCLAAWLHFGLPRVAPALQRN